MTTFVVFEFTSSKGEMFQNIFTLWNQQDFGYVEKGVILKLVLMMISLY